MAPGNMCTYICAHTYLHLFGCMHVCVYISKKLLGRKCNKNAIKFELSAILRLREWKAVGRAGARRICSLLKIIDTLPQFGSVIGRLNGS